MPTRRPLPQERRQAAAPLPLLGAARLRCGVGLPSSQPARPRCRSAHHGGADGIFNGSGAAAELLGVQSAFLRSSDAARLLSPGRSAGGQRRYSRADLTLASRVRALLDQNMPVAAATRIVGLEHQLAAAHRRITHLEQTTGQSSADASDR